MTLRLNRLVIRANAIYIGAAAAIALVFDIRGVLYGTGPQGRVLEAAPLAGIGFVEAHGLALILAVLLWRSAPTRAAHLTALALETLLGTCNLAFWQLFVATDALMMGYVTTGLHWTFVILQLTALRTAPAVSRHVGRVASAPTFTL